MNGQEYRLNRVVSLAEPALPRSQIDQDSRLYYLLVDQSSRNLTGHRNTALLLRWADNRQNFQSIHGC